MIIQPAWVAGEHIKFRGFPEGKKIGNCESNKHSEIFSLLFANICFLCAQKQKSQQFYCEKISNFILEAADTVN